MRGLKSTLALLVVLLGLGALHLFRSREEARFDRHEAGKAVPGARGVKNRRPEGEIGVGRRHVAEEGRRRLEARRRRSRCRRPIPTRPAWPTRSATSRSSGSSTRTRPTSSRTASTRRASMSNTSRRRPRSSGHLLVGAKAAAGGNLYARREDQKRVVLIAQYHESSLNKSTFDLRDKAIMKFDRRQGRRRRRERRRQGIRARQGRRRLEDDQAGRRARGLLGGRRTDRPRRERADEGGRHHGADASRPEEVRIRQAAGDHQSASGQRARHAGGRRQRPTTRRPTSATRRSRTSSPSTTAPPTTSRKPADDYRKKELFDFRAFDATHVELTQERSDGDLRARQGEGRQVAGYVASRQPQSRRSRPLESRERCSPAWPTFAPRRSSIRRPRPACNRRRSIVVAKFDDGKKQENASRSARTARRVRARAPTIPEQQRSKRKSWTRRSRRSTSFQNDRTPGAACCWPLVSISTIALLATVILRRRATAHRQRSSRPLQPHLESPNCNRTSRRSSPRQPSSAGPGVWSSNRSRAAKRCMR